ncbi:Protein of unknown function [Paracoccus halophilus]|uniref:Inner membrane protein YgaP-like transmembrane domain-containing protein n=1 Tax=Paracoccus halophilus TaxID=376733 RepID=A0A099F4H8_9RHOB|nr:DUF2892 domain-containing protein [Paracoccus halophilus]KGJ05198.1 hypothetical protein IT41_07400 [Paracoccus halophilus]SFA43605.1 Protein of unknown function [Paracoccus halophilus]
MSRNLGQTDRILRLVAGLIIAAVAWLYGGGWPILGPVLWLVAAVLVLTAGFATCPAYRLLGLSSCPLKKQ